MNLYKKILVLAVTCLLLVNSYAVASSITVPKDIAGTKYERALLLLSALGIMEKEEVQSFDPEDNVSRAQMASYIVKICGVDPAEISSKTIHFSDVAADNPAAGSIAAAAETGIMNGYGDGKFGPDEPVTYEQAIKLLVTVLGYDLQAIGKGGYPSGYLTVATENDITNGVDNIRLGQPITAGAVIQMLYNSLDADIMAQTGFGEDVTYSIEKGKTLLSEKLNIYKENGQITANYNTKLNGDSNLQKDEVEINNQIFKTGTTNADQLLGYEVTYYYKLDKKSDDNVLQFVELRNGKNDVLTIKADDIVSYDAYEHIYKYSNNNNDTVKANVARNAYIIYNGKYTTNYSDNVFKPLSGKVELLSTKGSSDYDIVFITSYVNTVVEGLNLSEYTIFDKYNANNNLVLDPGDSSIKFTMNDAAGNAVELKDLKAWNVLSVAKSIDGELIKVTVSNGTAQGKVTSISKDTDSCQEITINGKSYKTAYNYTGAKAKTVSVNDEGVFYFDVEGKVAAINLSSSSEAYYAYLIDFDTAEGIGEDVKFKLFDDYGNMCYYSAAKKVKVNGIIYDNGQKLISAIPSIPSKAQIIKYKLDDDGNVCTIITAQSAPATPDTSGAEFAIPDNNLFQMYNGAINNIYSSYNKTFAGKIAVTNNTLVFIVPQNPDAPDADDKYAVKQGDCFLNGDTYNNMTAYSSNGGSLSAEAIVKKEDGVALSGGILIDDEDPVTIVDKITTIVNNDNETVNRITGIQNGKSVDLWTENDHILSDYNVEQGDVIRYGTNSAGDINAVQMVYDVSNNIFNPAPTDRTKDGSNPTNATYNYKYRVSIGKVYNRDNIFMQVSLSKDSIDISKLEIYQLSMFKICMYDSQLKKVTVATTKDIYDYVHYGNDCSKVIVYTYNGQPQTIVIYK